MEMTEASEVQAWVRELVSQNKENNKAQLLLYLQQQLDYLFDKRPQMVAQVLYRLDVDEQKSKKALQMPSTEWSKELAKLIFEREMLRLEMRKKYNET